MNAAYTVATLVETDKFGMTTNGLGRLANKGEAGYIVKVTKSLHSLALINAKLMINFFCLIIFISQS